jgi:plastocyanin
MRRILIALALLTLAIVVVACASGNAPGVSSSTSQSGNAISIKDNAFSPGDLQTSIGTEVKWANNDNQAHQIVADDGSFDSGVLAEGRAFRHTFTKAGTYKYHCTTHGETGTVTVK